MEKAIINNMYSILPQLLALAQKPVWLDYDKEADVLYVSFRRPQDATETVPLDDHVLRRERAGEVVGYTILSVSKLAMKICCETRLRNIGAVLTK